MIEITIKISDSASGDARASSMVTTAHSTPSILRRAVVVGLDHVNPVFYGGWDGECPGTIRDAQHMEDMLTFRGYSVQALLNEQATIQKVKSACVDAASGMKDGDKLFLYCSSHGGSIPDHSGDENDGRDETICLYDGHLIDDVVYDMLCRVPASVEVDMMTDCCHSDTNWRGVPHRFTARTAAAGACSLLCFFTHYAGCGDGGYSYGSKSGGVFTNAMLDVGPGNLSREGWFRRAEHRMPSNQKPRFYTSSVAIGAGRAMA